MSTTREEAAHKLDKKKRTAQNNNARPPSHEVHGTAFVAQVGGRKIVNRSQALLTDTTCRCTPPSSPPFCYASSTCMTSFSEMPVRGAANCGAALWRTRTLLTRLVVRVLVPSTRRAAMGAAAVAGPRLRQNGRFLGS